ncbi:hypothetical protein [Reyranella sp.]|uniref:hypothetical protein n=1 Tax=Reyranella sp. TaxID=1929291 RepID=UPI003D117676
MSFPRIALSLAFGLPLLTGACAPAAVTVVSYGADGVSYAETGKSTTDHLASMVSKKDCAFWRVFRSEKVCREREDDHDPYKVDYDQSTRQPSEDGVSYAPPLRAPDSAPAASWTEETYKAAPTEAAATAPVGAAPAVVADVAPPSPAVTPKASPEKPAKTRKAKAHARAKPVRKASPGQAASVP